MKKAMSIIGTMFITCAFATDDGREITTSQAYVETQLSNRQDTIPAKTGDKVVTPTGTKGAISEREIKTTLGDEMTNQNDTGITTVETVKAAVDAKQNKLNPFGGVNVVTYTGTDYIDALSQDVFGRQVVPTTTPIYDENVNTYGNGLVRAETLNTAVQRGVSRALTQVPAGFVINKIGDVLPTDAYLPANIDGMSFCVKRMQTSENFTDLQGTCTNTLYSSMARGDWGVVMPYETGITYDDTCTGANCGKEIHGISVCSTVIFCGVGARVPQSVSSVLQDAYDAFQRSGVVNAEQKVCYCKLINPHVAATFWVRTAYASAYGCAAKCPEACGWYAMRSSFFRGGLFGGVDPTTVTNQTNE